MEKDVDILLLAAALPPLFLIYQIYKADKVEKEPVSLLIKLLIGGGVITFAAAFIESLFSFLYSSPNLSYWIAQFIEYFLVVALTEEVCKFLVLKFLTWNRPEFNYTFDGIVYSVTASLGFALVENILYVSLFGMHVALIRAFTAIVAHGVFGAIVGSHYGQARREAYAGHGSTARSLQCKGLIMAVILHGFYDLTASQEQAIFTFIFLALVVAMYYLTYKSVKKAQLNDTVTY